MSFNLFEAVKGHFNNGMVSQAAALLGEKEGSISNALNGMLSSVFGTLITKTSSSEGAENVAAMAKKTYATGILDDLGVFFTDNTWLDKGDHLTDVLFGHEVRNGIIENVAASAGIRNASAATLLNVAAPATLAVIGKFASDSNLGASGISALLSNSKNTINMSTENNGGSVGGQDIENASGASHDSHHEHDQHETGENVTGGVRWVVPLVLLAALAFLAWWLLQTKGCSKTADAGHGEHSDTLTAKHGETTAPKTIAEPKIMIDSSGNVSYELGKDVEFTLPDGTKFMAAENGFEAQFLNFIKNGTIDSINKSANWLNLFDVQFKSGGNEYAGKAMAQLKNAGAILKNYPKVKIKLGGYTDNTGTADANKKVSQQRADKVKADLLKMGATAGQVTESVGYGPEFPVCAPNDTPECKARNRRVACKVDAK